MKGPRNKNIYPIAYARNRICIYRGYLCVAGPKKQQELKNKRIYGPSEWIPCGQHLFLIHYSKLHIIIIIDGFSIIIFFFCFSFLIFKKTKTFFVFVFAFSCFQKKKKFLSSLSQTNFCFSFPFDIFLIHYATTRKENKWTTKGGHTQQQQLKVFFCFKIKGRCRWLVDIFQKLHFGI